MFNKNFYPTPRDVIADMYAKLDKNIMCNVLEPSAGKGDILDYIKETSRYGAAKNYYAVEIEPELRDILIGKGYMLIDNDFLSFSTYTRIDTIVMNPPFDEGDKHLLKALDIIKNGGQIVCLLNEETLKNPYSNDRKRLIGLLEKYEATIDYVGSAFKDAERKTNVNCAIVYVKIAADSMKTDIFQNVEFEVAESIKIDYEETLGADIVKYDETLQLIRDYRTEVELYLKAENAAWAYNVFSKRRHEHSSDLHVAKRYDSNENDTNSIIRSIRNRYWSKVLKSKMLRKYTTQNKINEIMKKIDQQSEIEFNLKNILEIKSVLMQFFVSSLEDAAIEVFDEATKHHQAEYSGNTHYYSGWRSNKAARINKKIVLPSWTNKGVYAAEMQKVLNYFDAFSAYEPIGIADYYSKVGTYTCEYFDAIIYKKGTMHIVFKRLDLLDRLNMFVGEKRNWIPASDTAERKRIKKEVCQHYKPDDEFSCQIVPQLLLSQGEIQ